MDVSPLSPSPPAATLTGERGRVESVRIDGMRFEMVGSRRGLRCPGMRRSGLIRSLWVGASHDLLRQGWGRTRPIFRCGLGRKGQVELDQW
jgi:hypothetical protein